MSLELQQAFIEYANSRDPDDRINHHEWATCAVGEFHRDTGGELYATGIGYVRPAGYYSWDDYAAAVLLPRLISLLNRGELKTYGELQQWIKENGK